MAEQEMKVVRRQIESGLNAPLASSMGRLFDAAASVLGVRQHSRYEGQAAMELEALAGNREGPVLPFPLLEREGGGWVMDPLPLLTSLWELRAEGGDVGELAAGFHDAVAATTLLAASRVAELWGVRKVALGGGVFQNARLLDRTAAGLSAMGLEPLVPRRLSPNDGAVSYGQAAVAAAVLQAGAGPRSAAT